MMMLPPRTVGARPDPDPGRSGRRSRRTRHRWCLPVAVVLALPLVLSAPADAATVKVALTARHRMVTLLPGVPGLKFQAWTFNGRIPGPVVRARVGDTIEITLRNADPMHDHSVDFHASEVNPMAVMAAVKPGRTKTISFIAHRAGVFLYHCGTGPVLQHVGMGMYGMVIVDPPTPRPPAQEIMLVQSEFYGHVRKHVLNGTLKDMLTRQPAYTAFNGGPFRYMNTPINVSVGRPVRIYLVDAGPSLGSAFHIVGEIFDAVQPDGALPSLRNISSTWYVPSGGGAVFEVTFDQAGSYTFLTHELGVASLGAIGRFVAG